MPSLRAVLVIIFACLGVAEANAMSCPSSTPIEHIGSTDIVFYGKVIKGGNPKPDNSRNKATFEVIRAYKGVLGERIEIQYTNDFGRSLGWGFRNGDKTLVFANKYADQSGNIMQGFLNYCSMIVYHSRQELHPTYWDILSRIPSKLPALNGSLEKVRCIPNGTANEQTGCDHNKNVDIWNRLLSHYDSKLNNLLEGCLRKFAGGGSGGFVDRVDCLSAALKAEAKSVRLR